MAKTAPTKIAGPQVELLRAVGRYVKKLGGEVLVAGGIQIESWPTEEFTFYVKVKCTGRKPELPK